MVQQNLKARFHFRLRPILVVVVNLPYITKRGSTAGPEEKRWKSTFPAPMMCYERISMATKKRREAVRYLVREKDDRRLMTEWIQLSMLP